MRAFGYRHVGRYFQRVFTLDDAGQFWWGDQHVPWDTVVAYRRADDLVGALSRQPHTRFFLADGRSFAVYTWLEEDGQTPRRSPGFLSSPTDAYQEFVEMLREKAGALDLRITPAGRFGGLWLVALAAGQAVAAMSYVLGLGLGLPLEALLIVFGGVAGSLGWCIQRHLQKQSIRRLHSSTSTRAE